MKNMIQEGDILDITAPYARSSGDFVQLGNGTTSQLGGICSTDIGSGATGSIKTTGVFDITALSTSTFAFGEPVYWDNTNKRCTNVASGNLKIGIALETKASGPTTIRTRLNGVFPLVTP
jgi:predicted RecA/RadA family phage recombinase